MNEEEILEQIIQNNRSISKMLRSNEELYQSLDNRLAVNRADCITVPPGIITFADRLRAQYHLHDLIRDDVKSENMSYLLEYLELEEYIFNRFKIYGSVRTVMLKNVHIICASFIETLIMEVIKAYRMKCRGCPNHAACRLDITRRDLIRLRSMKSKLDKLYAIGALTLEEDVRNDIVRLYNARNRVHVFLAEENELTEDRYTEEDCKFAKELIKTVVNDLVAHALPLYDDITCRENFSAGDM